MPQPIPFLDLVAPHRELEEELVAAFRDALRSAAFVGGAQVDEFEREFAAYCGAKHCVGVANGTDAVRFALIAAGVGPGDAVVTVPHTFIATVEGISQAGAATEFVDIDEESRTMSPASLEEYLAGCDTDAMGRPVGRRSGKPIRAILPVHLYGRVADMDALLQLARRYGLLVVEDACQAHGAEYLPAGSGTWRRAGSIGDVAAFSFYPGKNLGACGEAGAVTTGDERMARTVRLLREHGQPRKYYHEIEGYNGRLDAIQAAFLRIKLARIDLWNFQRRKAAALYGELLRGVGGVVTPAELETSRPVYHLYVVRAADRDGLMTHLESEGIHTALHYPLPLHLQECYRSWGYQRGDFPVAERVAAEILSLPMFPDLTRQMQERVASGIAAFEGATAGR